MQMSLFENNEIKRKGVSFVTERILSADSIRGNIKAALKEGNRSLAIDLFKESIRTYGFGYPNGWSWCRGMLRCPKRENEWRISASELADVAFSLQKGGK